MGNPEKEPKNPENKPVPPSKDAPKLDAILPDDLPPAAAELVGDIDSYQKKIEKEWESAKAAYDQKINNIMEEFMRAGMADMSSESEEKPVKKSEPEKFERKKSDLGDDHLKNLMGQLEKEMRRAGQTTKRMPLFSNAHPDPMQLPYAGSHRPQKKIYWLFAVAFVAMAAAGVYFYSQRVQVEPLPYTHTLGPVVWRENVYIMDWFRKSLVVHSDRFGLPIKSIETLPNDLATGLAITDKAVLTLDGFSGKMIFHATTPDHQPVKSVATPGKKPVGLFYDGTDVWSADQDEKKLYRLRGNDVEDIRDTYPIPDVTITAIAFHNNRFWLLDGKSRLIYVYRLQKPLLQLASFDLDPFVKGATPTGFAAEGREILVVTENPAQLFRIPISRLEKSTAQNF